MSHLARDPRAFRGIAGKASAAACRRHAVSEQNKNIGGTVK